MNYVEKHLLNDEQICYRANVHWVIFIMPLFWIVLTLILSLQTSILFVLSYITAVIAVVTMIRAFVTYYTSEYALTNKRVLVKTGLIQRQSLETFLQRIEGIAVNQNLLGRLFGFGTIYIIGTGGTRDPFANIDRPLKFRRKVQEQIEKILAAV